MSTRSKPSLAALCGLLPFFLWPNPALAEEMVTSTPPAQQVSSPPAPDEACPEGKRGGAIAGIVMGSVFWWLLPMSIPVLITQSKKLKAHNRAIYAHRCQYAPK